MERQSTQQVQASQGNGILEGCTLLYIDRYYLVETVEVDSIYVNKHNAGTRVMLLTEFNLLLLWDTWI